MIRAEILQKLLVDWFVKSLLPSITKDVALSGAVTNAKVILKAQQFYLLYYQYQMLYEIIPNALRSDTKKPKPMPSPQANGVIGSTGNDAVKKVQSQIIQVSMYSNLPAAAPSAQPTFAPIQTSDVNKVQSTISKGQ